MAAPKFNNNFCLKEKNNKPEARDNTRLKSEIEAYRTKINERLKNPQELKKAILVLEKMLNSK